ncbi:MAG TPA: transposase [Streptosporangiaceae bacterium]|nr:transposase [Streptosporangiaceae bacterium]
MLDWVPEGHAVRVVIGTAESLATRDLIARLTPPAPSGSASGPARYDPVMLLTVWMYAYLRGVLSTRAVEDRCRYDATFRVACGRQIPDHSTFSRFRRHLFAQDGLAEDLFYQVLYVCAYAGLGRLSVVAGDGVKIAANASKEANRTEDGLRKLAGKVVAGAREAAAGDDADRAVLPGTDLLLERDTVPGPRSRAGRIAACLEDLRGEREAARAQAREQGRAYLEAVAAGTAAGRPPAVVALAAARLRLEEATAAEEAALAGWHARRAAGQRAARSPAQPGTGRKARKARARLEALETLEAAAAAAPDPGTGARRRPAAPQRNITDPDSRLLPVRGGGFTQGYNCQDTAADDRLMTGGYACQDINDVQQAQRLAATAEKGAAVVAAGHAAHAGDPALLARCHARLCPLPRAEKTSPDHDAAACHHAITSRIGVLVQDAGYHSEANLAAPGPPRLIADGKTRDVLSQQDGDDQPAAGDSPVQANARQLRTPEGRATYKRRAPDVEGLHASLKDDGALRRFSLRGLHNATSEFLFAGLAHNLRLLTAIS